MGWKVIVIWIWRMTEREGDRDSAREREKGRGTGGRETAEQPIAKLDGETGGCTDG